jgi:hypothetical protein
VQVSQWGISGSRIVLKRSSPIMWFPSVLFLIVPKFVRARMFWILFNVISIDCGNVFCPHSFTDLLCNTSRPTFYDYRQEVKYYCDHIYPTWMDLFSVVGWKKGTGLKCTLNVKMTKTFPEKVFWYWYLCFLWEHSLKHQYHYEPTQTRSMTTFLVTHRSEVFLFHLGSGGTRPRRRTSRPTTPYPPLSSFTSFRYNQYRGWS